jgi:hypothetical protein
VAHLDLPALVIEGDQLRGGIAVVVEQGRDQPVVAGPADAAGDDGDLSVDDADGQRAEL